MAVGVGGDIVWAEGFGWADLEKRRARRARTCASGSGTPPRRSRRPRSACCCEKGRLHLDDEIQTYVPAFPRKQWPVTLRQLMGHVAGVRHYEN